MSATGLCRCGCGRTTSIAKKTRTKVGHVKGQHVPYIHGHARRKWDVYEIDPKTGCWNFTGYVGKQGYGEWYFGGEKMAHRAMYVYAKGPIPEGFDVDHTCCNRVCINPNHLEAVTPQENNNRTWKRGNHPCATRRRKDGQFAPSR